MNVPLAICIDLDGAIDRMGSRDLYCVIARSFTASIPETLRGIEAALAAKNWPEAHRLVHSLKSNCAAVGAEELRERAYFLEKACAEGDAPLTAEIYPPLREEVLILGETLLSL